MPAPDLQVETRLFADDGETINNPSLPVIVMRGTEAKGSDDPATWFERCFARHGWGASWRWGVYPFHHYHSTNHEVLGVASGEADLMLGGRGGGCFNVQAGDVIVIPAGVGHKCERCSSGFLVVGAYPWGRYPDTVRSGEGDIEKLRSNVAELSVPDCDPVFGSKGPLLKHWFAD